MATFAVLTQIALLILGVFLMIVILLQRGRGGGLAGAFGGLGGQSAFGTKAGDVFTKITVAIAILWVIVAGGSGYILRAAAESRGSALAAPPEDPAFVDPEDDKGAESDPFTGSAGQRSNAGDDTTTETPAEPADANE